MKIVNFELATSIVYGHHCHIWVAENALKDGVIKDEELRHLKNYAHCIFSGVRMTTPFSDRMHELNTRLHSYHLKTHREMKKEFIAKKIARELGVSNHLDLAVYLDNNDEHRFTAVVDCNKHRFIGVVDFDHGRIELQPQTESSQVN